MTINTITNSIKNKIENIQKADEKKTLELKDITLIPEFQKLLVMEENVLEKMKQSMREEGFKSGHEIHIWKCGKELILIDGHIRKCAWESLGNKTIPCIVHYFADMDAARSFALKEQITRRNLSGEALLQAVVNFNFEKGKGNSGAEKGKASEIIGKQLGVSSKTVEKARLVLKEASEEQKEAIRKEQLSINQVYNQLRGKASAEKPEVNHLKFSAKEKAFVDGIRYAITQINSGISLKELYHQTEETFDYSKMTTSLKETDFSKLFEQTEIEPSSTPAPEEA